MNKLIKELLKNKMFKIISFVSFFSFFFCFPMKKSEGNEKALSEGVIPIVLTSAERAELELYANNSKNSLQGALKKAEKRPFKEAIVIYKNVILKVVRESYNKKYHSELLMRFVLNQTLELTLGSRDPTKGIGFNGVLKEAANTDIAMAIYRESIKLALRYADDDIEAAGKGSIFHLPYEDMAKRRLWLAYYWAQGLFKTQLRFQFLQVALTHWHTTIAQRTNLKRSSSAFVIGRVEKTLKKANEPIDKPTDIKAKERDLLGAMNRLAKYLGVEEEETRIKKMANQNLAKAIKVYDRRAIKKWIRQGANINLMVAILDTESDDTYQNSILIEASRRADVEMVRFALEHRADVNLQSNRFGYTAIIIAKKKHGRRESIVYDKISDYLKVIEILLEYNADITIENNYGRSFLDYICNRCGKDHPDMDVIKLVKKSPQIKDLTFMQKILNL